MRPAASEPVLAANKQRAPAAKSSAKPDGKVAAKPMVRSETPPPRRNLPKKKLNLSPEARARSASSPGSGLSKIKVATTASQCSDADIALSLSAARASAAASSPPPPTSSSTPITTADQKCSGAEASAKTASASSKHEGAATTQVKMATETLVDRGGVGSESAAAADPAHANDEFDSTTFISAEELKKLIAQAKRHSHNSIAEEGPEEEEAVVLGC